MKSFSEIKWNIYVYMYFLGISLFLCSFFVGLRRGILVKERDSKRKTGTWTGDVRPILYPAGPKHQRGGGTR